MTIYYNERKFELLQVVDLLNPYIREDIVIIFEDVEASEPLKFINFFYGATINSHGDLEDIINIAKDYIKEASV